MVYRVLSVTLALLILSNFVPAWGNFSRGVSAQTLQKSIKRIELMPNIPYPLAIVDWKKIAQGYDALVFDFDLQGDYLPLIAWDRQNTNFKLESFRLPSYVGQKPSGEAINQLAALVGATLAGIDKSDQEGYNWVLTAKQYYNRTMKMVYNGVRNSVYKGGTFWYEIFPEILFYQLVSLYPEVAALPTPLSNNQGEMSMEEIMYSTADTYYGAAAILGGGEAPQGYTWTSFDFTKMEPLFNGRWREPDAAAGIAWMQYMAYVQFGEPRFLAAADWSLRYLENMEYNPLYELLLIYGAYTAARMNAELGRDYDLDTLLGWCFDPSDAKSGWGRPGWGIIADNWNGYDVHGLQGSVTDNGGYAFTMNSFQWPAALAPIVRYDQRYAHDLGKWILNVANNARLFYAQFHPDNLQSCAFWQGDPQGFIAYEGLRIAGPIVNVSTGKAVPAADRQGPYATGDALRNGWAPTDFGLYGSSHVGYLAGLVAPTNDPEILQIDLLATDFFRAAAYPTYLYYNPHPSARTVAIDVGENPVDLYELVTKTFLKKGVAQTAEFTIPPDTAVVLVAAPADGTISYDDQKMLIDGVVVDYHSALLGISNSLNGETVFGTFALYIEAEIPESLDIDHVDVQMNGQCIYEDKRLPPELLIDTTDLANGAELAFTVTLKTVNGALFQEAATYGVDNSLLAMAGADSLQNWLPCESAPAEIHTDDNSLTLTKANSDHEWGGVISPVIWLDLDREPMLTIKGIYAPGKWGLFLEVSDENGLAVCYKIYGPGTDSAVELSLASEVAKHGDNLVTGHQGIRLILANYGERNKTLSIWKPEENLDLYYKK